MDTVCCRIGTDDLVQREDEGGIPTVDAVLLVFRVEHRRDHHEVTIMNDNCNILIYEKILRENYKCD